MSESHPDSADFDRLGDLLGEAGLRPASPRPGSTRPPTAPAPPAPASPALAGAPGCEETPASVVLSGAGPGLDVDEPGPQPQTRRRASSSGRFPGGPPGRSPGGSPGRQETGKVSPTDTARRVAEVWDEAVGPEIAANARPVQLRQGRLVVSTSSSAWAQTLQFMGEAVRVRLNESLQTDEIRTVFFRHAGWEAPPDRGPAAVQPRASRRSPRSTTPCAEKSDTRGEGATTAGDGATQDGGATEGAASVSVATERAASPADGRLADGRVVEAPLVDTDRRGLTEEQRAALEGVRDLEVSPELREIIGRAMKAAFVREERQ